MLACICNLPLQQCSQLLHDSGGRLLLPLCRTWQWQWLAALSVTSDGGVHDGMAWDCMGQLDVQADWPAVNTRGPMQGFVGVQALDFILRNSRV